MEARGPGFSFSGGSDEQVWDSSFKDNNGRVIMGRGTQKHMEMRKALRCLLEEGVRYIRLLKLPGTLKSADGKEEGVVILVVASLTILIHTDGNTVGVPISRAA